MTDELPVLIHSREWLQNVVREAIDYNHWHIKKIKRKRAIAASAKAMTLADLNQRRAMLLWVRDLIADDKWETVPENIQINSAGEDVTPDD